MPVPDQPVEPSNATTVMAHETITRALESGDPQPLRQFLVGEGTCGQWIPAEPGDVSGPTIADEVQGLG